MLEPLYQFKSQFDFKPLIQNRAHKENKHFILCGMGGSALSGHILSTLFDDINITVHSDYGLPHIENKKQVLYIISSFSGNTEEALSSYDEAYRNDFRMAVITSGGELLQKAISDNVPYILVPSGELEPRFTIGYQMNALLTLMQLPVYRDQLENAARQIDIEKVNSRGKSIAEYCGSKWPILYSSSSTRSIIYAIKAAINEGSKRPCVQSVLPEANHNELEMFSALSLEERSRFMVLLISDAKNNIRVEKRIRILNDLYFNMGASPYILYTDSHNMTELLELLLTGYFFATYIAVDAGVDPYKTDTIRYFKSKLLE